MEKIGNDASVKCNLGIYFNFYCAFDGNIPFILGSSSFKQQVQSVQKSQIVLNVFFFSFLFFTFVAKRVLRAQLSF